MTAPDRAGDLCTCLRCQDERRATARDQFGDQPWAQVIPPILRGPSTPGWAYACATCGNKRCPHHEDHRFVCTRSNEPGQIGQLIEARDAALADLGALDADLIVMAPDASAVTEEAVEEGMVITHEAIQAALDEAGSAWGPHLYAPMDREILMGAALLAALPHLKLWDSELVDSLQVSQNALLAETHRLNAEMRSLTAAKDAEIERLREALGQISRMTPMPDHKANTTTLVAARSIARAALGDAT